MKKLMTLLVVGSCCAAMGQTMEDVEKIMPYAIKKVNFRQEGESISVVVQMVFSNDSGKTILLKNADFVMQLDAVNEVEAVMACQGVDACKCQGLKCGSDQKIGSISIPFGRGIRAADPNGMRNPMVLPPGLSLHCIESVFAENSREALDYMTMIANAFADPDYEIYVTMNGSADVGKYRLPDDKRSGAIFSSKLQFVDLRMKATTAGELAPDNKKYETHMELGELGRVLFLVK